LFNERGLWGPIRVKIRKIWINLKQSSSHEPMAAMHCYLTEGILVARRFKFVQIN